MFYKYRLVNFYRLDFIIIYLLTSDMKIFASIISLDFNVANNCNTTYVPGSVRCSSALCLFYFPSAPTYYSVSPASTALHAAQRWNMFRSQSPRHVCRYKLVSHMRHTFARDQATSAPSQARGVQCHELPYGHKKRKKSSRRRRDNHIKPFRRRKSVAKWRAKYWCFTDETAVK